MIALKNISKIYRPGAIEVCALQSVDLHIDAGEFVAITGPSGSGKSTLLHLLGLLDRPTKGSYVLSGQDISRLNDDELTALRSAFVGFVFQQFSLIPRTSAERNVMLPLIYRATPHPEVRARELLVDVGLSERLTHFPNQLSGGQQQRVAIARALANRPRVILADEPTGNLDTSARDEIIKIFSNLHAQGFTVIIVTHEEEVSRRAERVIRLKDGKIVEDTSSGARASRAEEIRAARELEAETVKKTDERKSLKCFGLSFQEIGDNLRQGIGSLRANPMRSFLSVLGVLIGVACLIAMLAIGKGVGAKVSEQISALGSNLLLVRPGAGRLGGARLQMGDVTRFTLEDVSELKGIAGIKRVAGSVSLVGQVTYKDKNWRASVSGVSPEYFEMRKVNIESGRFFAANEDLRSDRVCVIGKMVRDELFGEEDPIGKMVRIKREEFKVIGLLPQVGGGPMRGIRDEMVYVPLRTAMYRLVGRTYLSEIQVEAESPEMIPEVTDKINKALIRIHRLQEGQAEGFHIDNMTEIQEMLSSNTRTFSVFLGVLAVVSLLVGGIGIMNIMLVAVTERTREIGVRKAVGARNRDLLAQFLIESALLSVLGGFLGIGLGALISWLVAISVKWPVLISLDSILLAFAFSVFLGVGFGMWPAWRASRLDPIDALRYE